MLRVQPTTDQQRPRHAEDDRARHHRTRGGRRDASATQVGAESDASQRDGQSDRRDRPGGEPKLRSVVDNSIRGGRDHDRRIASAPARLKLRTVNAGPVFTRPLRAGQPPTAFAVRLLEPRHPASDVRRNRLGYHLVRGEEHRPGGWRRSGSAVHSGRAGVSRPTGHAARRLPACRLAPGESKTVSIPLSNEALRMLDRDMRWVVEPGEFRIMVGSSSKDIRLRGELTVQ